MRQGRTWRRRNSYTAQLRPMATAAKQKLVGGSLTSTVLAVCVVVAGTFYKIPQVVKIHRARSAKGVSLFMMVLDSWSCMVETSYSYANGQSYLDWGEAPSQLTCSTLVALQICFYEHRVGKSILAGWAAAVALFTTTVMHAPNLLGKKLGLKFLTFLKTINMGITVFSKLPQIVTNYKTKSTGQLSPATIATGCLGSVVRFYTLFKSSNGIDPLMVLNQGTSLVMNGTVLGQILYYNGWQ